VADLWGDVEALEAEVNHLTITTQQEIAQLKAKVKELENDQVETYKLLTQAGTAGALLGAGMRNLIQTLHERGVL
jgi:hypothetical protein